MTASMDMAKKSGCLTTRDILASLLKARRMGRAGTSGPMEATMKATSLMGSSKVTVSTCLQTCLRHTRESSKMPTWMVLALKSGKMEEYSQGNSKMGVEMVKAP